MARPGTDPNTSPNTSPGDGDGGFTPCPGAASLPRMVLNQASMEARLLLRNGEQLLLALVIPLLVLLAGRFGPVDVVLPELVPGVLALAVLSTSFTSLAIATGFERRYQVLKRLGASPLPRSGLLAGKVIAVLLVQALQFVVIITVASTLGWRPPDWSVLGPAPAVLVLGTAACCALGLLLAGAFRAEATLAIANLVYVLLLIGGAVLLPVSAYPEVAQPVIALLPSAALAEGFRTGALWTLAVLAGWVLVAGLATARTFRWE